MSPPKIDVHKTDDKMSIAGHDAQRTAATWTQTCTDKETGDVCDTIIAVDLWLTQDKLPGSADRHAFDAAYARKLGLDDTDGAMRGQVAKFLAPYQSQIKQLTDKSADLKGQPLKTSLRVLMGGQQCSAANKMKSGQASGGDANGANPMANVAQAGKAVSNLVGGLFHRKKSDDSPGHRRQRDSRRRGRTQDPGPVRAVFANSGIQHRDRDDQHRCRARRSIRRAAGLEEGDPETRQGRR